MLDPGESLLSDVHDVEGKAAAKFDQGKPKHSLVPPDAINMIAEVYTYGAEKYEADNWCKGFRYRRLLDALYRHLSAWNQGEDFDPESGFNHLAHAGCMLTMLLAHVNRGLGTDDRYKLDHANVQYGNHKTVMEEDDRV